MKHFLDITQLSSDDVVSLLQRATYFKQHSTSLSCVLANYAQHTMVNLFYEHSTRTRVSFELAAKKLNISVINFDLERSSQSKGETVEDTLSTLMAMGVDIFVLRHSEDGLPKRLSHFAEQAHFINAGDGRNEHPSQAMLDLMTILEHKKEVSNLKITIVGDIKHSRVAHSFQHLCALMNVKELVFVAPPISWPDNIRYGRVTSSMIDGLSNADVVMCLRIQRERINPQDELDFNAYRRDFALTTEKLKLAKKDAIVMHPGPINRGVEIDNDVADGSQSCILQQVQNGIFMRMAIFDAVLSIKNYS